MNYVDLKKNISIDGIFKMRFYIFGRGYDKAGMRSLKDSENDLEYW